MKSFATRGLAALATAGLLAASAVRADEKTADRPAKDGKPLIVQIDINNLPPDVAKRLLEIAGGKPTGDAKKPDGEFKKPDSGEKKPGSDFKKPDGDKKGAKVIGLSEAVAIAEKSGKGTAVRAARKGDGAEAVFVVELTTKGGESAKLVLTADGQIAAPDGETKKPTEKPAKDGEKPETSKGKKGEGDDEKGKKKGKKAKDDDND